MVEKTLTIKQQIARNHRRLADALEPGRRYRSRDLVRIWQLSKGRAIDRAHELVAAGLLREYQNSGSGRNYHYEWGLAPAEGDA